MIGDEQTSALRWVGEERGVAHMERVERALSEQGCVLLVGSGGEGVAEEVKGYVGVEGARAGSAAELLAG